MDGCLTDLVVTTLISSHGGGLAMPNPGSKDYCKVNPFDSLSELMRLLQNPLHLRILCRLVRSPLDVTGLQEQLELDQSNVSHALAKLKGCGALESERVKKHQIYRVSDL